MGKPPRYLRALSTKMFIDVELVQIEQSKKFDMTTLPQSPYEHLDNEKQ